MYIQKKKKINKEIPRSRNHWFFAIKKILQVNKKLINLTPLPIPKKKDINYVYIFMYEITLFS